MSAPNAVHRTTLLPRRLLNPEDDHDYLPVPDFSVVAGIPQVYWKIENEQLVEMSDAEKDAVDASQRPAALLDKLLAIDTKTREIIHRGFIHDTKMFSLSIAAQLNWSRLRLRHATDIISYPVTVSTRSSEDYAIADEAALIAFFVALDTTIESILATGRTHRATVRALVRCGDIFEWIDPRE
jgi:hypothetical protein